MYEKLPDAFTFDCKLTRLEVKKKVQLIGLYDWMGGDSEHHGLYLRGHPHNEDWPVWLYIYGEIPPRYLLDIRYLGYMLKAGSDPGEAIKFVTDVLLPGIGATNIIPTEGYK